MDYLQPVAPACIALKWHFAAAEGCIWKVGGRNKSTPAVGGIGKDWSIYGPSKGAGGTSFRG